MDAPGSPLQLDLTGLQREARRRDGEGQQRRRGLLRRRRVPWADVLSVEPAGRWRGCGVAHLADGGELELLGVGPEDLDRLASALADARGTAPEGDVLDEDDGARVVRPG